jgi:aromatic ring-opening dioxygenase LigB subunit
MLGGVVMDFLACVLPHGMEIIPDLAGSELERFLPTRQSVEKIASQINDFQPDTIVLATPHGIKLEGYNSIATSEWFYGTLSGNGKQVEVTFLNDKEFASHLILASQKDLVPTIGTNFGTSNGPWSKIPLDWGALIPLWFLRELSERTKVVLISPSREIPWGQLVHLGRLVAETAKSLGRRTVFIASADQGHAHHDEGPYGFAPESAEYDEAICTIIREQKLSAIGRFTPDFIQRAKPDSFWQLLILSGFLEIIPLKGELLSYQVPTYYGMITAIYK